MDDTREVLTWADFDRSVWDLAGRIASDGLPDMILSIARGGMLIGGALGYALGVKNTYTMNVEFYTGVDDGSRCPGSSPRRRTSWTSRTPWSSSRTTSPTRA